jgi:DNA polymerase-3 subunit gamma/tau
MSAADGTGGPTAPGLDLATTPAQDAAAAGAGYRVLARKYRPATFDDLIGQEAMVRTLSNAFESGRIPQAWILTGVRGVGKTTTARILARGLNYELPDGSVKTPTIRMPVLGVHCAAIMQSRHVDVLEMDAASHNGVDDIRQINDAVRYAPVNARYKVYILDEVHMLSTQAFNALLKTLEEPPPHAKFIFATTEIREVPITVLSRCQRFDLRRVESDRLVQHLAGILGKEGLEAEPEALSLIARAAEGSVRDSLSLLDQAISHAAGPIRAEDVRQMLGLVDRSRIIDLFGAVMGGDIAGALGELRDQYDSGADPMVVLNELAAFTHFVTRIKIVPSAAEDRTLAEIERKRGREFAASLSMPVLSRTWQMLLKGIAEVKDAARPIAAAEMVLVRIAYAAHLPSPEEVIRSLGNSSGEAARPSAASGRTEGVAPAAPVPTSSSSQPPAAHHSSGGSRDGAPVASRYAVAPSTAMPARAMPARDPVGRSASPPAPLPAAAASRAPAFAKFTDLIAFVGAQRDMMLKTALERDVRLVRFQDGRLEIALEPSASRALIGDLGQRLEALTGRRWMVVVSTEAGEATLRSQQDARREEFRRGVQADPLVQRVLATFPGAQIVAVRQPETLPPPAATEDDELPPEMPVDDGYGEPAFGADGPPPDYWDDM